NVIILNQNSMKKSIFKLSSKGLLFLFLATGILTGCGSDDSTPAIPGLEGKTMKFTVTINGVIPDDYISFVVAGGAIDTNTIWKVNGTERPNENAISLNDESFSGSVKTYVIETINPIQAASLSMQFIPFTNNSITYSYKAEVNGNVVKDEQNVPVTHPSSYSVQYSY